MEKKEFFRKLISGLAQQRFQIDEELFNESMYYYDIDFYQKQNRINKFLIKFSEIYRDRDDIADKEKFENDIRELSKIGGQLLVLFKLEGGFAAIVGAVDADNLSSNDCIEIAKKFDNQLVQRIRFYAGKETVSNGKLGTYGCLLYIFSDSQKATEFLNNNVSKCSNSHFWKKTYTRAWVIDMESKKVHSHSGIPIYTKYILTASELEKSIF